MSMTILLVPLLLFVDVAWGLSDALNISPGQFPSYASIVLKLPLVPEKPACGGAIINNRYILTSGQCDCVSLKPMLGNLVVKVGIYNRLKDDKYSQTLEVENVIVNKQLQSGLFVQIKEYDIGLVKVARPIVFNDHVKAATLPAPNSIATGKATVVGLGTANRVLILPSTPTVVQQFEVYLVDEKECSKSINGHSFLNNGKLNRQLCSKPVNKISTACKGDSGNPLIQIQDGEQVVIGIVSWAPYPCMQSEAPIVYTSVSQYIQWIQKKVQAN